MACLLNPLMVGEKQKKSPILMILFLTNYSPIRGYLQMWQVAGKVIEKLLNLV